MLFWLSVVAAGVIAVLGWKLYERMGASRIESLAVQRRLTSRMVSSGEFVDGNRRMKVVLALTNTALFYENADMTSSLDLRHVREIEYDSRLATGHPSESGTVLRMRCVSQVFEFVIPKELVTRWQLMLPPRRGVEAAAETTFATPVVAAI
jgi:hypothetical protein